MIQTPLQALRVLNNFKTTEIAGALNEAPEILEKLTTAVTFAAKAASTDLEIVQDNIEIKSFENLYTLLNEGLLQNGANAIINTRIFPGCSQYTCITIRIKDGITIAVSKDKKTNTLLNNEASRPDFVLSFESIQEKGVARFIAFLQRNGLKKVEIEEPDF